MVTLSDEEHDRLSVAAEGAGATLAGYLRTAGHQTVEAEAADTAGFWQLVGAAPSSETGQVAVPAAEHLSRLGLLRNRLINLRRQVAAITDVIIDPDREDRSSAPEEAHNAVSDESSETLDDYRRVLSLVLETGLPELKSLRCAYEEADERAAAARLVADDLMYTASDAYYKWAGALRTAAGDSRYDAAGPD